jgi:hypothetical protein
MVYACHGKCHLNSDVAALGAEQVSPSFYLGSDTRKISKGVAVARSVEEWNI